MPEFSRRTETYMASELLVGSLTARSAMEVHDDVKPSIRSLPDQTVEILEATARVELGVVHQILLDPKADRDPNGVETEAGDLGDVVLGHPSIPVSRKRSIGSFLAHSLDTFPLVVRVATSHTTPFVLGHPWLNDER